MTQGKTPVIGYGSDGHYIFCEERNSYMNVCGTWHKSMMGSGGTYFSSREKAEQALSRATNPNTAVEQLNEKYDTPDYNDGKWHLWSGRECPVHKESKIDHVWHDDNIKGAGITKDRLAGTAAWGQTLKFRVTKPYVEPKRKTCAIFVFLENEFDFARIGTIDTIDGQPVADSVKLTPL